MEVKILIFVSLYFTELGIAYLDNVSLFTALEIRILSLMKQ